MLESLFPDLTLVRTVLVGLVVLLVVLWFKRKKQLSKLPPGPPGLPIVGNLLELRGKISFKQFNEWSKVYGPAITIYVGPFPIVILNNIETVLEALVKRGADFATRAKLNSIDVFSDGGKDIAFGEYGPTWKLHRRLASKALRLYLQGDELNTRIHNSLRIGLSQLEKESKKSVAFDPAMLITLIVTNILDAMCFGSNYDFDDPMFHHLIKRDDELFELSGNFLFLEDFIPGLTYWPTKRFKALRDAARDVLDNILGKRFYEHRERFDANNIRDFTDFLIQAKNEVNDEGDKETLEQLSDTHLIQTIADIYFAGIDTSRFTLRAAVLHMVAFPEIQEKVQKELDAVLDVDELPSLSHRPRMAYTEAVLHESMRISSVFPTGLPHQTYRDTKIGEYDIPKGTDVIINHWALHNDPRKWKDVDKFIPERFLDEDGKLGPKPESWLPFSAGRRVCLGESVAKPELHLIFAALMHRFTWRLPKGDKLDMEPEESIVGRIPKPQKYVLQARHSK